MVSGMFDRAAFITQQILLVVGITLSCPSAFAENLGSFGSTSVSAVGIVAPTCSGSALGDLIAGGCEPPNSVRIHCPNGVTVACDGGNSLTPDCVLHVPVEACFLEIEGLSPGSILSVEDLRNILKILRSLYDHICTYSQALAVCTTAHEAVHGIHASRQGQSPLLACASEIGAFDESIRCLSEALQNCSSQQECDAIQRELDYSTRARNYNQCLCSLHPNQWLDGDSFGAARGSQTDWPSVCASCEASTGYEDVGGAYCTPNNPDYPWILG